MWIYRPLAVFILSSTGIAINVPAQAQETAFCRAYAQQAMIAVNESNKFSCGFGGARYAANKAEHYDACMSWGNDAGLHAIVETNSRTRDWAECLSRGTGTIPFLLSTQQEVPGNQMPPVIGSFCNNYADIAIQQVGVMQNQGCGFTGPRWDQSYNAHRDACLAGFGPGPIGNIAAIETMSRVWDIKECQARQVAATPEPAPAAPATPPPPKGDGATHKVEQPVDFHDAPQGNILGFIPAETRVIATCDQVAADWCDVKGYGWVYKVGFLTAL